jgi:hypothetical protein
MDGLTFNAQFVLYSILAGLAGAAAMTLVLGLFGKVGWTRANLVVALGQLFSQNRNTALLIGATIHAVAGAIFAMVYTLIFALFHLQTATAIIFVGLGVGWAHGIVASLIFVVSTVLGNPEGEMKKVQFAGGPAYMVSHMVFGFVVGVVIGISPLLTTPGT